MKYPTKLEATREWVRGFNAIPYGIIQRLVADDIYAGAEEWREVTTPQSGDSVELHFPVYGMWGAVGEVLGYDEDANDYVIELDDGTIVHAVAEEFHVIRDSFLPMWRTLWSFGDRADDWWLKRGGINIMSECGFRIYERIISENPANIHQKIYDRWQEIKDAALAPENFNQKVDYYVKQQVASGARDREVSRWQSIDMNDQPNWGYMSIYYGDLEGEAVYMKEWWQKRHTKLNSLINSLKHK